MKLKVQVVPDGSENPIILELDNNASVSQLKNALFDKQPNLVTQRVTLKVGQIALEGNQLLRDLHLEDKCLLALVQPPGSSIKVKATVLGRSVELVVPSDATIDELQSILQFKEGLQLGKYELMFRGQKLVAPSTSLLADFHIGEGATIEVILPRSSIPKGRCSMTGCCDRVAKIVGECRYCGLGYCSRHRLPESHACDNIQGCRQQSYEKNSSKLMGEKCVPDKF